MQTYLLRLSLQAGIGPVLINHIISECRDWSSWDHLTTLSSTQLAEKLSISRTQAALVYTALHDDDCLHRHDAWLQKGSCRVVTVLDDEYPMLLKQTTCPPPVLWVQGAALPPVYSACALVGARAATSYAQRVVAMFVPGIVAEKVVTVSGGARGVDSWVHKQTLAADGHTVVVAGCGMQYTYPAEHEALFKQITEQDGTLISPFAPWIGPSKGTFPARNRIIAGLAQRCVVVQAAARSGALITATYAMEENRDVGVIPGPVDDVRYVGSNALLSQGAAAIVDDVGLLRFCGIDSVVKKGKIRAVAPEQQAIIDLLEEPATFDDLMAAGHTDPSQLQALLYELQVAGIIRQNYAGFWERCE